jgi:radical SAM protein with 4Fe4S-binding SPASM domain
MTYENWLEVLKQGAELGCQKVQFIGGEPTLYPHLLQLIAEAKKLGYEFLEVFTNGTVLNDSMFETFCKYDVNLALSVYSSSPSTHDSITTHKGSHTKTIENIKRAVSLNIPVRVGIVEMEENDGQAESTERLLRDIGVESIGTDRLRGIGRGGIVQINPNPMKELCGACWQGQLTIDPKGDVFPCVFSRFCKLGHVSEGLASILEKESLHTFRKEIREMDEDMPVIVGCKPGDCRPYCRPSCSPTKDCHPRCMPW